MRGRESLIFRAFYDAHATIGDNLRRACRSLRRPNRYRIKENIERTSRGGFMSDAKNGSVSRRSLLHMIGTLAGSTAMYNAMTEMGFAQESGYAGPPKLGAVKPG